MTDSRSRFEAWREANAKYIEPADFWPWMEAAWQAAEAETARRCAQAAILHNAKYMDYRAFDKIKAEFPEAWK
jgi:hypothetical protein